MKNLMRVLCLVLVLAALLCGCGKADTGTTEKAPATEPQATEPPAPAAITTEADLAAALANGGRVALGADLQLTQEILVKGSILDGGRFTVTGPEAKEGVVETENGITVAGGTVENVTIKGKYRAIGDRKDAGANSDVRLKNVKVDGADSYALNFGYGNGSAGLYVDDSTLCGWSSYTKFQQAIFTNCTFGYSENGNQGNLRPYINTTLVGCKFEGRTEADGTVTPFNISFKNGTDGIMLTLEDCYVGDTLITQENVSELLKVNLAGNTIVVHNTN